MDVLTTDSGDAWRGVLAKCPEHDFHHLPEYHAHAEKNGEGAARFLVYREGDCTIAVPLLLRPLADLPGLGESGRDFYDATSVYGYAGPVASRSDVADSVVRNFSYALEQKLRELRVVTVFSRLHPLFEQRALLAHMGGCVATGRTVSLDLTPPIEEQYAKFRKSHRRGLKKLRELGLEVIEDRKLEYLDEFAEIYTTSMHRVGAAPQYFFDREYFSSLVNCLGPAMRLFCVRHRSTIVAATLYSAYNGIVHAHLGGTADHALEWSPDKLLTDEVRLWAAAHGYRVFHHGGGVGAREDGLHHFKAGFSDCSHEFLTWRWVVDPIVCRELCDRRAAWSLSRGIVSAVEDYFPAYRVPHTPPPPAVRVRPLRSGLAGVLLGGLLAEGGAMEPRPCQFTRLQMVEVFERM